MQYSYPVAAVGTEHIVSGPSILSVKVNNPTGMWLYIPEMDLYIPSNTLGWVQNFTQITNSFRLDYVDGAAIGGNASTVTGTSITITTYDTQQAPSNGLAYTAASSADVAALQAAIAAVDASVLAGNASQATAANQALQATAAKQTTAETKLDLIVDNTTLPNDTIITVQQTITPTRSLIRTATSNESWLLYNTGIVAGKFIYIGGNTVTPSTGAWLVPGEKLGIDVANGVSWYAIINGVPGDTEVLQVTSQGTI